MTLISNILYSNPKDFCDAANEWAEQNIHLAKKIKEICQKPESNIKYEISNLDDLQAIKLMIACLGYTKIDPSELVLPTVRDRLKSNLAECGHLLGIPSSAILPIATIEKDLLKLISEK